MQTFLPYPSFIRSAQCLDYRRLGKQRVEAWQIYCALTRSDYGWQNHPAVNMWRGHEYTLLAYGTAICTEWVVRGYNDNMLQRFEEHFIYHNNTTSPAWLGSSAFHSSHRAALLHKDPTYYSQFGWTEAPALAYVWPKP